jgi:uracil-DNA glycosylase
MALTLEERNTKLDEINENIWKCDDCEVRSYYKKEDIYFRPEPFSGYTNKSEYRMLYVAINPGWNRNNDNHRDLWTTMYACSDYATYVQESIRASAKIWIPKNGKKDTTDIFPENLSRMADTVRKILCRDIEVNLSPINYEKYVFRSQLSYCASQSPTKRIIFGKRYEPDGGWGGIFGETRKKGDKGNVKPSEVSKCRKHLTSVIKYVKPEVIMFLGQYSRDHFTSNKTFLADLLGKNIDDIKYN